MAILRKRRNTPTEKIDVTFVSTTQFDGGASIAAYRLFCGIRSLGIKVKFLSFVNQTLDPDLLGPQEGSLRARFRRNYVKVNQALFEASLRNLQSPFSLNYRKNRFRPKYEKVDTNVLHMHWIAKYVLDFSAVPRRSPVVWTLHDSWAYTGGCHYTQNCGRFTQQCGRCPQLESAEEQDASRKSWISKKTFVDAIDLTVVTPSKWLADEARRSGILGSKEIVVIPNGIDTQIFKPIDKTTSRREFGFSIDTPVLLFGAQYLGDKRKGSDLLIDVLEMIDFQCLAVTFGSGSVPNVNNSYVKIQNLGSFSDEKSMSLLYSAADVFLCPSREDNLPNTVMEAMACGVPVVAFRTGGLSDLIDHGVNGYLCSPFDTRDFASSISKLIHDDFGKPMGSNARSKVESNFDIKVVSRQYQELYSRVTSEYQKKLDSKI